MFDIGMLELGLIAVVALLVIGPERLPAVARTVGFWFGKARKFVTSVQDDFNREVIKSEELKRLMEEQSKLQDVHEIIEHSIDESRKTVSTGADIETAKTSTPQLDDARETANDGIAEAKAEEQQKTGQKESQAAEESEQESKTEKADKPEQVKS
ncbi:Sec-independent protein translocase protein TatB [Kaarinaea lacus]